MHAATITWAPPVEEFLQAQETEVQETKDTIYPSEKPTKPFHLWQETVYNFRDVSNRESMLMDSTY